MISRLHISSIIGLTIIVWILALWIQGMPLLDSSFLKPFGTVVGVIASVVMVFNKYMWSWKVFQGWYIKRPDLRGTWKVLLQSSWEGASRKIEGYAVVRQSLTTLSLRLLTEESKSVLIAHSIEIQEEDSLFKYIETNLRLNFKG